jgi:heat shock protein HslJ
MRLHLEAPALLVVLGTGCGPQPPGRDQPPAEQPAASTPAPSSASAATITDKDWILVSLGKRSAPLGAGDRPLTLRLDSASSRATGFAGCNRYSGGYTLAGDSLKFSPAVSTKMSCGESDQVEQGYLAMLPLVVSFTATDTSLVLSGPGGALARFRKQ